MVESFVGRHYEAGTLANALLAGGLADPHTCAPYSEALVFGASGGIAFGQFVFEYKGQLPHIALLTRNTFSPFERALDNLAIRREVRETTSEEKGIENLRRVLDTGEPAIVWADAYSMPYRGLDPEGMWSMQPLLVLGLDGAAYRVVDGTSMPFDLEADVLTRARARVKKDRYRVMTLEAPDPATVPARTVEALRAYVALMLDSPPVGSLDNFGVAGMRALAEALLAKTRRGWSKQFEPGPRLVQALAGRHGQPGVWDWIETWGTRGGADRGTYADFLREAARWTGNSELAAIAPRFENIAEDWKALAEAAMPDAIPEFARLKALKIAHRSLWFEAGLASVPAREEMRREMVELTEAAARSAMLAEADPAIRMTMAELLLRLAEAEFEAANAIRRSLPPP